ncbi:fasciclin domain-containing protein [Altericroceibacterium spongiae]|uniref:Fasciclin domain-containing protein n=1 Tax=Altericroceibacterium spongiae TaxID=2320269 RepID=A0A420EMT9_9SPHN|nr:fasciclin domain-containing protein [Altericroceibacterium spongiae]RKF21961.1 fasciclin domain-containing protein [Altericroceibacterium spongiae]
MLAKSKKLWSVTLATLLLCACHKDSKTAESSSDRVSQNTLAASLAEAPGITIIATEIEDNGLAPIFDGTAPYTLLAPRDPAFGKLGQAGALLQQEEQAPAMMAILRDHIMPGYLTVENIKAAIARAGERPVKMRNMSGHELTFSQQGGVIHITAADGSRANIAGPARKASNGIILPIDGILKDLSPSD